MSRVMGLPGKPKGMDGSQVESYYRDGRIDEIADYCQSDVLNTYRLWLRYELFRGRLTRQEFDYSDTQALKAALQASRPAREHVQHLSVRLSAPRTPGVSPSDRVS